MNARFRTLRAAMLLLVPSLALLAFAWNAASTSIGALPSLSDVPAEPVAKNGVSDSKQVANGGDVLKLTTFQETASGSPPRPKR